MPSAAAAAASDVGILVLSAWLLMGRLAAGRGASGRLLLLSVAAGCVVRANPAPVATAKVSPFREIVKVGLLTSSGALVGRTASDRLRHRQCDGGLLTTSRDVPYRG